jgi:tetratricopeptide (TPR) repeat protein
VTGIDRDAIEAERDFLLRSLDDLEAEREDGNVDDGTYRTLHDDYTARAAAAIRSLDADTDLTPETAASPSKLVRGLTIGGIVAFAFVAAFVLAHAVGQRHAGQTITGNSRVNGASGTTGADPGPALAAAAAANPRSYPARIAYARYLMAQGELPDAIREFGAAARLDPNQPEPPTYAGWAGALLTPQVKDATTRRTLLDASLSHINEVTTKFPQYPDAHALKGVILYRYEGDAKDAIPEFQKFLALTDDSNPIRNTVLSVLAQAERAAKAAS